MVIKLDMVMSLVSYLGSRESSASGRNQRGGEDQRAALPVVQGDHGGEEEAVRTISLADAGIDPTEVGLANSATEVVDLAARPPREAGLVIKDEGDAKVAAFLAKRKFI